jgi:6-pyruvoyltetrahydropterin/6-carboxytetrahydropterin synthase
MFNRAQCKEAIKILRPMYIQLYGKDLEYKRKGDMMYYSEKTFNITVPVKFENKTKIVEKYFYLKITVYCRSRELTNEGCIINLDHMEIALRKNLTSKCLNDVLDNQPTLERLAEYIYEQVIPCYKVRVESDNNETVIYEEEED